MKKVFLALTVLSTIWYVYAKGPKNLSHKKETSYTAKEVHIQKDRSQVQQNAKESSQKAAGIGKKVSSQAKQIKESQTKEVFGKKVRDMAKEKSRIEAHKKKKVSTKKR